MPVPGNASAAEPQRRRAKAVGPEVHELSADSPLRRGDPALIAALAGGASLSAAAEAAQLSTKTARRRLADETVRTEIFELRRRMLDECAGRLAAATNDAAETLLELLRPGVQDSVRLAAARAILDRAASHELTALEERIAVVERVARAGRSDEATFGG